MTHVDIGTQWRGRQDTGRWRFRVLLVLSGALHVGLTPWAGLWGLARWLPDLHAERPPEEAVNAIPVDLIANEPGKAAAPTPEPVPPSSDSNTEEEEPAAEEAPEAPAPKPAEPPPPPAPAPPEPAPEVADDAIGDPVALSGTAGKIADANANVRLMLYTDRIREHALGRRIGRLLNATPQWRDFFGPAQVDPIRDIDRVLIAGPQLRDSSNVVAVVQHSLPDERMEKGLEALVARGGGEWMEGQVKMAKTRADRAERLIVLPAPGIVAVVPPSAEKSARSLGKDTRFAGGPEGIALQAYLVTPWRVFLGLPVQVPKSIKWVRVEVQARPDGGATARIVAEDESPEEAARNAREIEQLIRAATELKLSGMGALVGSLVFGKSQHNMLERVSLRAEGKQILGTVEASLEQLSLLTDLIATAADFYAARSTPPLPTAPPNPAAPPSSAAPSAPSSAVPPSSAPPSSSAPSVPSPEPPDEAVRPPDPDSNSSLRNGGPAADE